MEAREPAADQIGFDPSRLAAVIGVIPLHSNGLAIRRLLYDGIPHASLIVLIDRPRPGIFSDEAIEEMGVFRALFARNRRRRFSNESRLPTLV
jgi:hypothetical protein